MELPSGDLYDVFDSLLDAFDKKAADDAEF